jgi:methionyl-tRNA formyltransferase
MKKLIAPLVMLLSLLSVPAQANSCTRPYLLPAADQSKRIGTINVQVLFVKFADSGKKSKGYIDQHLSNIDLNEMNNYVKETSQGKAKLKFIFHKKWVTLPNNSYQYGVQGMMSEQEENAYMDAIYNAATDKIDFSKSGKEIYNLIRGLSPYPSAWCFFKDGTEEWNVKLYEAKLVEESHNFETGSIITTKKEMKIAVNNGFLEILSLQFPGKKRMKSFELLNGITFSTDAKAL